jgi:hypothetical protein
MGQASDMCVVKIVNTYQMKIFVCSKVLIICQISVVLALTTKFCLVKNIHWFVQAWLKERRKLVQSTSTTNSAATMEQPVATFVVTVTEAARLELIMNSCTEGPLWI